MVLLGVKTVKKVVKKLNVNKERLILTKGLNVNKVCYKMVSENLSSNQKMRK